MLEMKSDEARRVRYQVASNEAKVDTYNYGMHKTMEEHLHDMREKQLRKKMKRRKPWFLIITVVTTIPFFFMGDDVTEQAKQALKAQAPKTTSQK